MTKDESLRRLYAEMASVGELCVAGSYTRGRLVPEFAYRCFPDHPDVAVRNTFLDALTEAERHAGVPVYGPLTRDHDRDADDDADCDEIATLWRASDRALLGVMSFEDSAALTVAESRFAARTATTDNSTGCQSE